MTILHLGCGDDIHPDKTNLDPKINGWTFESGLPMFADGSVDGITISHAIQNIKRENWSSVFGEFYRVLRKEGVIRITDDDTETPSSPRYKKPVMYKGKPVTPTGPGSVRFYLKQAGFRLVMDQKADATLFESVDLLIAHREHKKPHFVFYIEAVK